MRDDQLPEEARAGHDANAGTSEAGGSSGSEAWDQSPRPTTVESASEPDDRSSPSRGARLRGVAARIAARTRAAIPSGRRLVAEGASVVRARPRRSASIVAAVVLAATVVPAVALRATRAPASELLVLGAPSVLAAKAGEPSTTPKPAPIAPKAYQPPGALTGLDLKAISVDDNGAVASAANGRIAKLTLDPRAQIAATRLMAKHKLPEAAVVMIEPSTGKVLVYASRGGGGHDLAAEAGSPSASVFKIVTGSALVQIAGVSTDTKVCYGGGDSKLEPRDLRDDPKIDKYCATLSQAMGRSINAIFAKLAQRKLSVADLNTVAGNLGYGVALPFDVPVQASKLDVPSDPLAFARTSAGFYNTTLSPLHAALLASTVANGGTMMRPWIVSSVADGAQTIWKAPAPSIFRKALEPSTARAVETMMLETVANGTSFRAFHDAKGKSFLPGIEVAGKTGTLNLTPGNSSKLVTWFVGYAPAKNPKVAIASMIVNDPVWKVKANTLAREVLQYWFAENGSAGVVAPSVDP